jgi:hypothetical protein
MSSQFCQHPEAREGEVWFTNGFDGDKNRKESWFDDLKFATKRKGLTSFNQHGEEQRTLYPVFVSHDELMFRSHNEEHVCKGWCGVKESENGN